MQRGMLSYGFRILRFGTPDENGSKRKRECKKRTLRVLHSDNPGAASEYRRFAD